ncbi:hypothetical protein [Burkholderia multivorans]|uniref:hypothetical protein n=2 Tax=Burkholderia multivorans TaxID=87883 RepID=UPI001C23FD6F|nr:hypothetical protein [Burkholderia multivorans]MBU9260521.1 hypothetical protein [Burkholderia multivorans]MBU9314820.1 hypothetical protein [Burkholderia multivorans]MDN7938725.1 hypothetical protein [Burkholderia multivorans]MDR8916647.1 hypothetical protein [Burkholderia multivorans]MDR8922044.1 hypothetical protein [Burkholderia multivorans]
MPLPEVVCPNCRARMSLDVILADDSMRDIVIALADIHPAGDTVIKPLLRYLGLFGPRKSQMAWGRMAALMRELVPEMRAAQVTWNGTTYAAPIDTWAAALAYAVEQAHAGKLDLPLKSHGWLRSVIASRSARAAGRAEDAREAQLRGVSGTGTVEERRTAVPPMAGPITVDASLPKAAMPEHIRKQLKLKPRNPS